MSAERFYLRIDDDMLEQATGYRTKAGAISAYSGTARELARYGQECTATIHIAPTRAQCVEYPDLVLSLGPRGGIKVEAA